MSRDDCTQALERHGERDANCKRFTLKTVSEWVNSCYLTQTFSFPFWIASLCFRQKLQSRNHLIDHIFPSVSSPADMIFKHLEQALLAIDAPHLMQSRMEVNDHLLIFVFVLFCFHDLDVCEQLNIQHNIHRIIIYSFSPTPPHTPPPFIFPPRFSAGSTPSAACCPSTSTSLARRCSICLQRRWAPCGATSCARLGCSAMHAWLTRSSAASASPWQTRSLATPAPAPRPPPSRPHPLPRLWHNNTLSLQQPPTLSSSRAL